MHAARALTITAAELLTPGSQGAEKVIALDHLGLCEVKEQRGDERGDEGGAQHGDIEKVTWGNLLNKGDRGQEQSSHRSLGAPSLSDRKGQATGSGSLLDRKKKDGEASARRGWL